MTDECLDNPLTLNIMETTVAYSQIVRCGFVLIIDILKGRRDCLVVVVHTSDKWNRKTWTSMLS